VDNVDNLVHKSFKSSFCPFLMLITFPHILSLLVSVLHVFFKFVHVAIFDFFLN